MPQEGDRELDTEIYRSREGDVLVTWDGKDDFGVYRSSKQVGSFDFWKREKHLGVSTRAQAKSVAQNIVARFQGR